MIPARQGIGGRGRSHAILWRPAHAGALADSGRFHRCRRSAYPLLGHMVAAPFFFHRGRHPPLPAFSWTMEIGGFQACLDFSKIRRICSRSAALIPRLPLSAHGMGGVCRRLAPLHAVHVACRMPLDFSTSLVTVFPPPSSAFRGSHSPASVALHGGWIPVPSFLDFQKFARPVF